MSKPIIRHLELRDAEKAAAIQVETWKDTYQGLMPSTILEAMTFESMLPKWKSIIGENVPKLNLLGVFEGQELLGMAASGMPREKNAYEAELWSMNIPSRNKRRGLGRLLFHASVECLHSSGYRSMYLYCIDKNLPALAFYRSMGGTITDREADRDGYRELIVAWERLSLSGA